MKWSLQRKEKASWQLRGGGITFGVISMQESTRGGGSVLIQCFARIQ